MATKFTSSEIKTIITNIDKSAIDIETKTCFIVLFTGRLLQADKNVTQSNDNKTRIKICSGTFSDIVFIFKNFLLEVIKTVTIKTIMRIINVESVSALVYSIDDRSTIKLVKQEDNNVTENSTTSAKYI